LLAIAARDAVVLVNKTTSIFQFPTLWLASAKYVVPEISLVTCIKFHIRLVIGAETTLK
jgi:hypothetical protein